MSYDDDAPIEGTWRWNAANMRDRLVSVFEGEMAVLTACFDEQVRLYGELDEECDNAKIDMAAMSRKFEQLEMIHVELCVRYADVVANLEAERHAHDVTRRQLGDAEFGAREDR